MSDVRIKPKLSEEIEKELEKRSGSICAYISKGNDKSAFTTIIKALESKTFSTKAGAGKRAIRHLALGIADTGRNRPDRFMDFAERAWSAGSEEESERTRTLRDISSGIDPDILINMRVLIAIMLGPIVEADPDLYFPKALALADSARIWRDLDNLVGYALYETFEADFAKYFPVIRKHTSDPNPMRVRCAQVLLGRFMYEHPDKTELVLTALSPALPREEKIIRDANAWVLGTWGVRADQDALARHFTRHGHSNEPNVIWSLCQAIKKTSLPFSRNFHKTVKPIFEKWAESENPLISRNAKSALERFTGGKRRKAKE